MELSPRATKWPVARSAMQRKKRRPGSKLVSRAAVGARAAATEAPSGLGSRLGAWLKGRKVMLGFLLRFALLTGVELTVYYFPYDPRGFAAHLLDAYLALYAHLAGVVLSLVDSTVHVHGTDITGRFSLTFAMNCDAMDVFVLFSSAVVAFPSTWRRRVLGLFAGLLALIAVNVVRIVSLYWIGVHLPSVFEFVHVDLWPLVIVATTCLGFLYWARGGSTPAAVVRGAAEA